MDWRIVQRDFVERTLRILKQYDEYTAWKRERSDGFGEFDELEVTLLVNCLDGLVLVPYEYATRGKRRGSVAVCRDDERALKDLSVDWGLAHVDIDVIHDFDHRAVPNVKDATLRIFLYRMRNSIAHSRFEDGRKPYDGGTAVIAQPGERNPSRSRIEKLVFKDIDPQDNKIHFQAVVAVEDLRKFGEKFAAVVLDQS